MPILSTTKLIITDHAKDRFEERIGPIKDMESLVRNCRVAGREMRKRIRHLCPKSGCKRDLCYLITNRVPYVIFVAKPEYRFYTIITCFPLEKVEPQ